MPNQTNVPKRALPHPARGLLPLLLTSLLLAGCGGSSDNKDLEARVAAAEAKADAAEKRSQQALSMAIGGSSQSQFGPEPEVMTGDSGQDESMLTDNSGDSGNFDNQIEAPSPPMVPPG